MKYFYFFLFFGISISLHGQVVSSTGNWTFSKGTADIVDAGLNLNSTENSNAAGETTLEFSDINGGDNFRVDIRKVDTNWDSRLQLTATKFSDGTNSPSNPSRFSTVSPAASAASQLITNTYTGFFTILFSNSCNNCRRINLKIRYVLSGISVEIPAATYTTQVQYTIINL